MCVKTCIFFSLTVIPSAWTCCPYLPLGFSVAWDMVVINKHLITDQFPEKKANVLGGGIVLPPCPLRTDSPEPAVGEWSDRIYRSARLAQLSRQISLRLGGSLTAY